MLPKHIKKKILTITTSFLLLFLYNSQIYAQESLEYTSISLSPATGTIGPDATAIQLNVNSGSSNFVGYDINISFAGQIEYISATEASVCNSFFDATEGSSSLDVSCLSSLEDTYNGSTATLYFRATDNGIGTLTITNNDDSVTITTISGGSYTTTMSTSPVDDDPTDDPSDDPDNTETLPQSGIFDDSPVVFIFGFLFIILGGVLLITKPGLFRKWKGTVVIYDD
jgi:hypothetical protein